MIRKENKFSIIVKEFILSGVIPIYFLFKQRFYPYKEFLRHFMIDSGTTRFQYLIKKEKILRNILLAFEYLFHIVTKFEIFLNK